MLQSKLELNHIIHVMSVVQYKYTFNPSSVHSWVYTFYTSKRE